MRAHAPRADIDDAIAAVEETGADLLIGFGGSSVTDATKIVAVRSGTDAIPQVHVPTTLSSGEWTPASGMTGDEPGVKTYVVDPRMAPFAIVLDPEVTLATPRDLWLSTGVKAIDHACEAMWGPRAHPFTDTLAAQAIRILRVALPATTADPTDLDARLDAQLAGWMSMAGVVNVRVHLSHTLGHQIGARWDVPHGITSGITLPPIMRYVAAEQPEGARARRHRVRRDHGRGRRRRDHGPGDGARAPDAAAGRRGRSRRLRGRRRRDPGRREGDRLRPHRRRRPPRHPPPPDVVTSPSGFVGNS